MSASLRHTITPEYSSLTIADTGQEYRSPVGIPAWHSPRVWQFPPPLTAEQRDALGYAPTATNSRTEIHSQAVGMNMVTSLCPVLKGKPLWGGYFFLWTRNLRTDFAPSTLKTVI